MQDGTEGATSPFSDLLAHWTQKHSRAVYVPYERLEQGGQRVYRYAPRVLLGRNSDLTRFIHSIWAGTAYYDPGCKLEGVSTTAPKSKSRNQFRVTLARVPSPYERVDWRDVAPVV